MEDYFQFSVFDVKKQPLKIDKPVRLIELFAGIGSQAKALERLGVDFEHYRVCEFDKYAIKSYNAIHGTNFATSDITKITAKDLGIVDTYKWLYMLTYSFPCQDLSLAGKQKGMAKGDDTRSGLLWEVERLLNECDELPQVLLMENVTQVHGKKNVEHFDQWIKFLESKGYSCFWKDLNAKNFGIPQNRNRTFMVSILGDYTYEFPKEFPLELRLKDMLEDSVDEKFYLSDKMIQYITANNEKWTGNNGEALVNKKIASTLNTGEGHRRCDASNYIANDLPENFDLKSFNSNCKVDEPKVIGGIGEKKSNGGTQWYQQDRVYDNNMAMSVTTVCHPYYKVEEPQINVVGNYSPSGHDASRIVDTNGLAPTDKENHGTVTAITELPVVDVLQAENDALRKLCQQLLTWNEATIDEHRDEIEAFLSNAEKSVEPLAHVEPNTCLLQPKDRNYKEKGGQREVHIETKNDGVSHALRTKGETMVAEPPLRIRKLTPKECWRLMGFDDADFEKAAQLNSNAQLYKQAGNSIVVDVLYYIFKQMF